MLSDERSQAVRIISQSRTEDLTVFSSSLAVFTLQLLNLMFDSSLHMSDLGCFSSRNNQKKDCMNTLNILDNVAFRTQNVCM